MLIQLSKDHTDRDHRARDPTLQKQTELNIEILCCPLRTDQQEVGGQHIYVAVHTKSCVKMSTGDVI